MLPLAAVTKLDTRLNRDSLRHTVIWLRCCPPTTSDDDVQRLPYYFGFGGSFGGLSQSPRHSNLVLDTGEAAS